jgi:2-amino-4-hydroxy-6-hydroxymethyldihydropteridine diphosphokinase
MIRCYVAIGSNLGNPQVTVDEAIDSLAALRGSILRAMSSLYRTAPIGISDKLRHQPDFINAVVALDTRLPAAELLDELFAVEARFGRIREPGSVKNAPRTLDLDLLLYGDLVIDDERLTLPHPRMHLRAFVLAPLAEIAPGLMVPGHGPVETLLEGCRDQRIHPLVRHA